jgi:hypothetical protein
MCIQLPSKCQTTEKKKKSVRFSFVYLFLRVGSHCVAHAGLELISLKYTFGKTMKKTGEKESITS